MELEQSVIAITGAGQGLGQTMATSLASQGASLALLDVNQDALTETKELCEAFGVKAQTYQVDVTNEEQVEQVFSDIVTEFGALNGLVNNAGILRDGMLVKARGGEITKMSLGDFNAVINVNLTGTFLCGREAAVKMIESDSRGVIINISSVSRAGNMGQTNYSAAKAGVAAMTVTWAKELSRYGVRCAGIAPGFIATEMVKSMKPEALEKYVGQ